MKQIIVVFIALLAITTRAHAIESQFPGETTAGVTPEDVDTPKYYPPQKEIPPQTLGQPENNPQQQNH
ncbi:MAG: hypothetical protein Q8R24_05290 [Legionellaceae bacterium]|nr:hypothetical protein [Legionellaceae bacterium]